MPESHGKTGVPSTLSRQFLDSVLSVALPSSCILCGQDLLGTFWGGPCQECWRSLKPWTGPVCHRCGLPLLASIDDPGYLCGPCRLGEPRFDVARSYGIYTGKLRNAVLQVKFHQRERLGLKLGGLLMEPWQAMQAAGFVDGPALIVPVPLHRSRERERGYNQARLLAEGFALALKSKSCGGGVAKIEARCLARKRPTPPQSGLNLQARSENVRGVFAATEKVRGHNVILIDDVMTTGSTVSACAIALKRAGAGRVAVLALARATPQFPDLI